MSKITIVTWELLEMGGINRVIGGFQSGLAKLGHEVRTFHGNKNGHLRLSQEHYTLMTKWYRPMSENLGWTNFEQLKDYRECVKESDLVLIIHPCPHPTKSGAGDDTRWQRIYEIPYKAKVPVAILFTDNLWDRLYPWIIDIIDDDRAVCLYNNYNAKFDAMDRLPHPSQFIHYPMDFNEVIHYKSRKIDVSWLPQWKKWKGIYQFIEALSNKSGRLNTVLFNSGIEYYNIRKTSQWEKAINYDRFIGVTHNKNSTTNYYGLLEPNDVARAYASSRMTIDLSGAYAKKFEAQVTCVMIEAMMFGTIMAVPSYVEESNHSLLYKQGVVFPVDKLNIIESIEEFLHNKKAQLKMQERAYAYVKEYCEDTVVSQSLLDIMGV